MSTDVPSHPCVIQSNRRMTYCEVGTRKYEEFAGDKVAMKEAS
jgi:hypothetical protein